MDTSKEFIKMCEKAKDIRKFHYPEKGDFYWYSISFIIKIIVEDNLEKNFNYTTWLPRQDQLQEMVNVSSAPYDLIARFEKFISDYPIFLKSMEQLWLAFVMKEKYNKVWDGKDWRTL